MGRGIVATIYFQLKKPMSAAELREAYAAFYADEPFVRILPEGAVATNRNVRLSNYCDISLHLAYGGKTAIVVSAIDNMVKGAAGQAIQNMVAGCIVWGRRQGKPAICAIWASPEASMKTRPLMPQTPPLVAAENSRSLPSSAFASKIAAP